MGGGHLGNVLPRGARSDDLRATQGSCARFATPETRPRKPSSGGNRRSVFRRTPRSGSAPPRPRAPSLPTRCWERRASKKTIQISLSVPTRRLFSRQRRPSLASWVRGSKEKSLAVRDRKTPLGRRALSFRLKSDTRTTIRYICRSAFIPRWPTRLAASISPLRKNQGGQHSGRVRQCHGWGAAGAGRGRDGPSQNHRPPPGRRTAGQRIVRQGVPSAQGCSATDLRINRRAKPAGGRSRRGDRQQLRDRQRRGGGDRRKLWRAHQPDHQPPRKAADTDMRTRHA